MVGIYDLWIYCDEVLVLVLKIWKVWDCEGFGAEGE